MLRVTRAFVSRSFSVSSVLADRRFTRKHEWITVSGRTGTEALGDVVYVDLPEVGSIVKKGDTAGAVESVKAASDIYSPVSGKIIENNALLADEPGLLNKSPFDKGWLYKLELTDADEVKTLLTADEYEEHKKEEEAAH